MMREQLVFNAQSPKGRTKGDLKFNYLKGVFAKNEMGYRLNAIKSAFDRY